MKKNKSKETSPEKNTFEKIYTLVKKVPKGKVATYGQFAHLLENPHLSRVSAMQCTVALIKMSRATE